MSTVVILSLGVAVVLGLPIAARVRARRFDPFEPIFVFALAWGVMFVIRPIAMAIRDDRIFYGVDISSTLDKAVLLGLVGAVAFCVGYAASFGRRVAVRLPASAETDLPPRVLLVAGAAGLLGVGLFMLFLLTAGGEAAIRVYLRGRGSEFDDLLEDSPQYLLWLSLITVPAALVAFAIAYRHRRPRDVVIASLLIGLVLLRTIPTGGRLYLLMLVGGVVAIPFLQRLCRPGLRALSVALVLALASSYVLLTFRYSETRGGLPDAIARLASSPERAISPLIRGPDAEMAPALAGALLVVPDELPYRLGGASLGDLVRRPIPRQLWGGKPQPHTLQMTATVWPVARETGNFNPAFTPLLSFYWDFGLLGVMLGMLFYGALARVAYEYLLRAASSPEAQLVYAVALWTVVVAVRFDPVLLFLHCLIMFVPLLVIVRLGSRGRCSARAYFAESAAER